MSPDVLSPFLIGLTKVFPQVGPHYSENGEIALFAIFQIFDMQYQELFSVFQIFDDDGDGLLSYQEFVAMMKDRIHRGLKSYSRCRMKKAFSVHANFFFCIVRGPY